MGRSTTIFLALFIVACNTGPEPIQYGADACHYCKMTIVDKPFGCELVSQKGKVVKFDAIECLVAHYKDTGSDSTNSIYVSDFAAPGSLIEGTSASYLHTESIPSPMGAFLSAHRSESAAKSTLGNHLGEIHDWQQLLTQEY